LCICWTKNSKISQNARKVSELSEKCAGYSFGKKTFCLIGFPVKKKTAKVIFRIQGTLTYGNVYKPEKVREGSPVQLLTN